MAFQSFAGFTSAIATDPAATAAGYLTPTRYNLPHVFTGVVSGGIPYGTSTTTQDYSALLASGGVVIGGGAGAAPATVADLTYASGLFTAGAITVGSSSAPSGTQGQFYRGSSAAVIEFGSTTPTVRLDQAAIYGVGNLTFQWGDKTNTFTSSVVDTSLSRGGAGIVRAGTGGNNASGSFSAAAYIVGGVTGADFGPGLPTSITVVKGIITAIS